VHEQQSPNVDSGIKWQLARKLREKSRIHRKIVGLLDKRLGWDEIYCDGGVMKSELLETA
jgi:hypothetical protein